MTLVQLVERLRQETGTAGNVISTVVGLEKERKRLLDWVVASWEEIQLEAENWDFLRKAVTFNTVAGQQQYHVGAGLDIDVSDFGEWRRDSFRSYLSSAGVGTEVILSHYYDYSDFRDYYLLGSRKLVTGRPLFIAANPSDRSLLLGFTPDDVYTVSGEYYRTPQLLTADADEPLMPVRYHMAIVYKAMIKYGMYEAAQEQITAGQEQYAKLFNRLVIDQTPPTTTAGSFI
jgi:hypothetical protein